MKSTKVLFITQEIIPYVPKTPISVQGQKLPASTQQKREIRTFMPRWGNINERRNQLHEVIRLSGMNIIIDETDHPLIIKVASIQPVHMQVYFIDNDEYFQKGTEHYADEPEEDGERAIFYARGVLETVKKLRWNPDLIHCQGWISALVPLFVKTMYGDEPAFKESKVVFSPDKFIPQVELGANFGDLLRYRNVPKDVLKGYPANFTYQDLEKMAIDYADGYVEGEEGVDSALLEYAKEKGKPALAYPGEGEYAAFNALYDDILAKKED